MTAVRKYAEDLTGRHFGRLIVTSESASRKMPSGGTKRIWICRCSCGNEIMTQQNHLQSGKSQSCGCRHKEIAAATSYKHGGRHTKLYDVWTQMLQRCENKRNKGYSDYGARGITVCTEWHAFEVFRRDMIKGYGLGLSIDRENNNAGYCKNNCRWATPLQQANNSRSKRKLTDDAVKAILSDRRPQHVIAKDHHVSQPLISMIKRGRGLNYLTGRNA